MKNFAKILILVLLSSLVISSCGSKSEEAKTTQPLSNKEFQAASLDQEVYQNAITLLNEKLCDSITDKDLKENCKTTVQDQKLLSKITTESVDSSKCGSIKTDAIKAICEAQIEQKVAASKQAETIQKETSDKNALLGEIVQSKNISDCTRMNDKDLETLCVNGIYRDLALERNDKSLCNKITDKDMISKCINFISN